MLLALDIGDRYIGLAAGNPMDTPIHRLGTIDRKKEDPLVSIAEIVHKEDVTTLVVGLPVGLEGNRTKQTEKTQKFIDLLQQTLGEAVRIVSVDETLTSIEAARHIRIEGGNVEDEHAEAARIMLTEYLELGK